MSGDSATPVRLARTLSFARRTRALTPAQQRAFSELAPLYLLDLERGIGETTISPGQRVDLHQVFGRESAVTLEIGSGSGEQIVAAAKQYPQRDFLAYEVWRPGIAKMMYAAAEANVSNLRIVDVDAVQSLPILLAEATISEVWTFFPDPWRKARHHKRRLVQKDFAREIARLLVDGGKWRLATDWEDYAQQMLEVICQSPDFVNPYQESNELEKNQRDSGFSPEELAVETWYAPRFTGRVLTKFEERGIAAGRKVRDILAVRKPRESEGGIDCQQFDLHELEDVGLSPELRDI